MIDKDGGCTYFVFAPFVNEQKALMSSDPKKIAKDKQDFVCNIGCLLAQTLMGVTKCFMQDESTVVVQFKDHEDEYVHISDNTYMGILYQILEAI